MPMVWYIPPLSPVVDALRETGHDAEDRGNLFGAIEALRIPVEYLAELFTAGQTAPVTGVLRVLAAMRAHMRRVNLGETADPAIAGAVGMTPDEIEAMYRLLAIARYEDRYVIPPAHVELAGELEELPGCSVDYSSPGEPVLISIGELSVRPAAAETFDLARRRAAADKFADIGRRQDAGDAR